MSSIYPQYGGGAPLQRCQKCGMQLPPNELYCRNCGMYNAPASMNGTAEQRRPSGTAWNGPPPQTYQDRSQQPWGQMPVPPVSSIPYGQDEPYQQLPFPNGAYNSQNPSTNPVNYYPPFQQNAYAPPISGVRNGFQSSAVDNNYTPAGFSLPPQKKSNRNLGILIGVVLLLLLLVGGGVAGYLLLTNQNSANKPQNITTQSVVPSPTPSAKPLFSDALTDNKNGWDLTGSTDGKVFVKLGSGTLQLADNENTLFPEFIPGKTFNDFQMHINATLSNGDQNNGYGAYIRVASTQNDSLGTYYRFELYGDGTYAVFKGVVDANGNSTSSKLVDFTSNAAIKKQGGINSMTITAKGSSMTFIVNGIILTTVTDSSYKGGSIALFVSNVKDVPAGAQAVFSNLAIYPATA